MACHGDIGHVGRGGDDTVGQPRDLFDADMGLQAEVPLLSLAGLDHLRVTLPGFVLGGWSRCHDGGIDDGVRRSCRHDGGVDDGTLAHEQALLGHAGVDLLEDPIRSEPCFSIRMRRRSSVVVSGTLSLIMSSR